MSDDKQFDVFLSHNSQDKPAVEGIAERLKQAGLNPWLDKWHLVPGTPYQPAIEQALATSAACAVFVSASGAGPWQDVEVRAAISRQVSSAHEKNGSMFRVIPVLLPGAFQPQRDQLPAFLRELTWVEFRTLEDADAFRRLTCGIRGEAPGFTPARPAELFAADREQEKIVPHGLRSFTADDSRFFLRLIPGPRDHRGLPASIAFWKDRIEQVDPDRTFSVGLLYGPSGCGKSSLVKAGLLPRLAEYVRPLYLEATPADTERQLLARLRKLVPGLPAELDLPAALGHLRESSHLAPRDEPPEIPHRTPPDHLAERDGYVQSRLLNGCKLVLILDQFEQWLHGNLVRDDAPLIVALRHCDGAVLQAVLMVRDDFFLGIHRFLTALDRPIRQGENMALVDLFDPQHARRVLREFARAYDRQPDDAFLDQAVAGLQDDEERLVAVHLALFADMLRNKDWTPEMLTRIGGATGVGRMFLEEHFDHSTANPTHRVHRPAAIRVLKALLPPRGAELKGARQTQAALREISGYAARERDFAELQKVLVTDLRLVSPSAADESESAEPSFQLTHDYLVPALRDWLTAKDKETRRGRARLALEERTEQWTRDPEHHARFLPTLLEFAAIIVWVRQKTPEQQTMMSAAKRWFGVRAGVLAGVLILLAGVVGWKLNEIEERGARDAVAALLNALPDGLLTEIRQVRQFGRRGLDKLRPELQVENERRRHQAAIALAVLGEPHLETLLDAVLKGAPSQCANLVEALRPTRDESLAGLRQRFEAAGVEDLEVKVRLATVALHLGDPGLAQTTTKLAANPALRTAFIHRFPLWHGKLSDLFTILHKTDPKQSELRSAVASALALLPAEDVATVRGELEKPLHDWYLDAPDGPTHSAAYCALKRWEAVVEIPADKLRDGRGDWWTISVSALGVVPDPHSRLTMLKIPAGTFRMGSDKGAFDDERPVHDVKLTKDFYVSDREITVGMFRAFVADVAQDANYPRDEKAGDWEGADRQVSPMDDCPVQQLSWIDAVQFCNWLSRRQGREPCYTLTVDENGAASRQWKCQSDRSGFRLLTEAEWEYACRARAQTEFAFGDDSTLLSEYAVYDSDSNGRTRPAGTKQPNGFGLFDMPGNVWEWCGDVYDEAYYAQFQKQMALDPPGPSESSSAASRVLRGGSWNDPGMHCRSANRDRGEPGYRDWHCGFRVATGQRESRSGPGSRAGRGGTE